MAGLVAGAVTMAVAGLIASRWIKSPQEVAADAQQPRATVITAVVQRQVLRATIAIRGTVSRGRLIGVDAVAPQGTDKAVVTRMPVSAGQRVTPGQVLAEIDGRPIFVLRGVLPAYRDLRFGDTGPDVAQLQASLRGLGYGDLDPSGRFGSGTAAALHAFYAAIGYSAPEASLGAAAAGATSSHQGSAPASRPHRMAYLPESEVVFVPRSSELVASIKAHAGDVVGQGPVLQLTSGGLRVTGILSADQKRLVHSGQKVTMLSEDFGISAHGVVAWVGSYNSGAAPGASGPGYPVTVYGNRPLPLRLAGDNVRLTFKSAATRGPVLVVPVAAVFSAADGSADVLKVGPGIRRTRVAVTTGASANGLIAVRPAAAGALAAGDRVALGTSQ